MSGFGTQQTYSLYGANSISSPQSLQVNSSNSSHLSAEPSTPSDLSIPVSSLNVSQGKANPLSVSPVQPQPSGSWVDLGPTPIGTQLAGVTYGTAPLSGRVTAIAINQSNSLNIYLGAASGGVWKSLDDGLTWAQTMDNQSSLAIGAIAFSPDQKTLYVGTGEASHSGDSIMGAGLLKSTDGGKSWIDLGQQYFADGSISSIIVDPSNPNHILVSTTWGVCCVPVGLSSFNQYGTGVYLSTDGGSTWALVLRTSASYPNNGIAQLLVDPSNSNTIYAGDYAGNVWRSMDGGVSWKGLLGYSSTSLQGRVAIAMSQAAPNVLYAAFANSTSDLIGIFEFNFTSHLNSTFALPAAPPAYPSATPCGAQCNYDLVLAVDPVNPSVIYFGARDLYVSTNSGKSWTDVGGLWYPSISVIHPDQHAVTFLPNDHNTVFVGNDGGIWKTSNEGASWTNLNTGLGITQFYGISVSPSNSNLILGGTQDNGLIEYIGTTSWQVLTTGDVSFTGFEKTNSNIMYAYIDSTFDKSSDGGNTWVESDAGINPNDPNLFLASVAQDPNNQGTLYVGATDVYKTTNFASSWTDVSGTLKNLGKITDLEVAPSNSNILYSGDLNGLVRVSTNAGSSWKTILSSISSPVSSIAVDPNDASTIYVSFATRQTPTLMKSTNQGSNWANLLTTSLPQQSVDVIKVYSNALYIGTDSGVFASYNGGSTWSSPAQGLPNVPVVNLVVTPTALYAVTHGRGVWKLEITTFSSLTLSYSLVGGGTGYQPPTLTYMSNGTLKNATLSTTSQTFQVDVGSVWNVTNPLVGSTSVERWETNSSTSSTVSTSPTSITLVYYRQEAFNGSYSVIGGGVTNPPLLSSTEFGQHLQLALSTKMQTFWLDYGTIWSLGNVTSSSTQNQRWATTSNLTSGSVAASFTISPSYYHQYLLSFNFSIIGGGTGYAAPNLSYMQFGVRYETAIPTRSLWLDSGFSWNTTSILLGSSSIERWETNSSSAQVVAASQVSILYFHQYLVSISANPQGSGTVAPSGTAWYDAGSSVNLLAIASNSSLQFIGWETSSGSLAISNSSSPSAKVLIGGSGSIVGNFVQLITTSTTSQVPEFPGASLVIAMIVALGAVPFVMRRFKTKSKRVL